MTQGHRRNYTTLTDVTMRGIDGSACNSVEDGKLLLSNRLATMAALIAVAHLFRGLFKIAGGLHITTLGKGCCKKVIKLLHPIGAVGNCNRGYIGLEARSYRPKMGDPVAANSTQ